MHKKEKAFYNNVHFWNMIYELIKTIITIVAITSALDIQHKNFLDLVMFFLNIINLNMYIEKHETGERYEKYEYKVSFLCFVHAVLNVIYVLI